MFVIHSAIHSFNHPLVKISLFHRHAQMGRIGASSHKTHFIYIFLEILHHKGHQNRCIGSKVSAILLNVWIFHTSGVVSGTVCACSLRSKLLSSYFNPTLDTRFLILSFRSAQGTHPGILKQGGLENSGQRLKPSMTKLREKFLFFLIQKNYILKNLNFLKIFFLSKQIYFLIC